MSPRKPIGWIVAVAGAVLALARGPELHAQVITGQVVDASTREPVVAAKHGGKAGGGAALTPLGKRIVECYRDMERAALEAASSHLKTLGRVIGK